jgi:hypothetical protein
MNKKTGVENCITITVSDQIFNEVDNSVSVSEVTMKKFLRLCKALVAIEGGIESSTTVTYIEANAE